LRHQRKTRRSAERWVANGGPYCAGATGPPERKGGRGLGHKNVSQSFFAGGPGIHRDDHAGASEIRTLSVLRRTKGCKTLSIMRASVLSWRLSTRTVRRRGHPKSCNTEELFDAPAIALWPTPTIAASHWDRRVRILLPLLPRFLVAHAHQCSRSCCASPCSQGAAARCRQRKWCLVKTAAAPAHSAVARNGVLFLDAGHTAAGRGGLSTGGGGIGLGGSSIGGRRCGS
jgi:hypothetical protein